MSLWTNGTMFIAFCWMWLKLSTVLTTLFCSRCFSPLVLIMSPRWWFFSYLSGRRIRTKVSNHLSSPSQGSVLGLLLFLIYNKDIPSVASALTALNLLMIRCCFTHWHVKDSNLLPVVHSKLTWMRYRLGPLI